MTAHEVEQVARVLRRTKPAESRGLAFNQWLRDAAEIARLLEALSDRFDLTAFYREAGVKAV